MACERIDTPAKFQVFANMDVSKCKELLAVAVN